MGALLSTPGTLPPPPPEHLLDAGPGLDVLVMLSLLMIVQDK